MDYSNWLTMGEVGQRLARLDGKPRTRAWAHSLLKRGYFPSAVSIGGQYMVNPTEVDRYIDQRKGVSTNEQ